MKRFYLILLLGIMLVGTQVFASVVTTKRRIPTRQPDSYTQQRRPSSTINNRGRNYKPQNNKNDQMEYNLKTCKPYSESLYSDLGGVGFNFNIQILGWQNGKCRVTFKAESAGITSMFESLYGVSPDQATIQTFEPKINCAFTREQLARVGDTILQERARNAGATNNMLIDPTTLTMPSYQNASGSDKELFDVLLNEGACQIMNSGVNSQQIFESVFGM